MMESENPNHEQHNDPHPELVGKHFTLQGLENGELVASSTDSQDPSQTGHWSANPSEVKQGGKLPETNPDNMPGDTEVQSRTIWHRY